MDKNTLIIETIVEQGMLPLFFHADPDVTINVVKALYDGGIRTVEYTNRGTKALQNFKLLKEVAATEMPGLQIGIGTIKNVKTAAMFIDAGADYLISPGYNAEIAESVKNFKILWIPGCMTPTEIMRAEEDGLRFVKLFPGNVLGPGYMAAIKELFPDMTFMPTGGVDTSRENLSAWFKAGVSAVGMGSKLITADLLATKNYSAITANTKEAIQIIHSIKAQL